jgi:hypothetical protein
VALPPPRLVPGARQSSAHRPAVTSHVGNRQKRSAYVCRSASLKSQLVGGVGIVFETLYVRKP